MKKLLFILVIGLSFNSFGQSLDDIKKENIECAKQAVFRYIEDRTDACSECNVLVAEGSEERAKITCKVIYFFSLPYNVLDDYMSNGQAGMYKVKCSNNKCYVAWYHYGGVTYLEQQSCD